MCDMDPVEVFGHRGRPPAHSDRGAYRPHRQAARRCVRRRACQGGREPTDLADLVGDQDRCRAHPERNRTERVGISGPTLIHYLDRLESAGLVARTRDGTNRRVLRVTLTPSGERAFLRLREAAAGFDGRLRRGITDEQMSDLRRWLEVIDANVEPESTSIQPSHAASDATVGRPANSGAQQRRKKWRIRLEHRTGQHLVA